MRFGIVASKGNGGMVRAVEVGFAGFWRLWFKFEGGAEGEADISNVRDRPRFAPLRDPDIFQYAYVHPLRRTICWDSERIGLARCGLSAKRLSADVSRRRLEGDGAVGGGGFLEG